MNLKITVHESILGIVDWDKFDPNNQLKTLSMIPLSDTHRIYKTSVINEF
jgi:hypothetical protein